MKLTNSVNYTECCFLPQARDGQRLLPGVDEDTEDNGDAFGAEVLAEFCHPCMCLEVGGANCLGDFSDERPLEIEIAENISSFWTWIKMFNPLLNSLLQ